MKKTLLILIILGFCVCSYAQDFTTINEESIQSFIKLLPEYKTMLQKFSGKGMPLDSITDAQNYAGEVQALFSKYGITMEQFPVYMQKISMGFATLQMQKSGMGDKMGGVLKNIKDKSGSNDLTDDELKVLKTHEEEIQTIFQEE